MSAPDPIDQPEDFTVYDTGLPAPKFIWTRTARISAVLTAVLGIAGIVIAAWPTPADCRGTDCLNASLATASIGAVLFIVALVVAAVGARSAARAATPPLDATLDTE